MWLHLMTEGHSPVVRSKQGQPRLPRRAPSRDGLQTLRAELPHSGVVLLRAWRMQVPAANQLVRRSRRSSANG